MSIQIFTTCRLLKLRIKTDLKKFHHQLLDYIIILNHSVQFENTQYLFVTYCQNDNSPILFQIASFTKSSGQLLGSCPVFYNYSNHSVIYTLHSGCLNNDSSFLLSVTTACFYYSQTRLIQTQLFRITHYFKLKTIFFAFSLQSYMVISAISTSCYSEQFFISPVNSTQQGSIL